MIVLISIACTTTKHLIRCGLETTTYNTVNVSEVKSLSYSRSQYRETFTQSQDRNSSEKVSSEQELDVHEEESEEIHGGYIHSFAHEVNCEVETPLEGVPCIRGQTLGTEIYSLKETTKSDQPQSVKKSSIKTKKKQNPLNNEEQQKAALEIEKKREISFRNSLKSYLTMCMQQNMVYKAMMLLRNYHGDEKYVQSSEVYDAVLREAASNCSWKLIKDVVVMMEEKGVPFSLDSFAACFVCLGRRSLEENNLKSLSENLLDKMASCGLSHQDIFMKCKFTNNQRELAIKGIRQAIPDFDPPFPSIPSTYTTTLLSSLNNLNIESTNDSPVSGLLTSET